jgi:hypothetical protein
MLHKFCVCTLGNPESFLSLQRADLTDSHNSGSLKSKGVLN